MIPVITAAAKAIHITVFFLINSAAASKRCFAALPRECVCEGNVLFFAITIAAPSVFFAFTAIISNSHILLRTAAKINGIFTKFRTVSETINNVY